MVVTIYIIAPIVKQVIKRVESFFSQFDCESWAFLWNRVKGCMSGKRACCLSLPAPLGKVRTFTCCCTCSLPFYAVTFALKLPSLPLTGSRQWASRGRERSENEENVALRERIRLELCVHFMLTVLVHKMALKVHVEVGVVVILNNLFKKCHIYKVWYSKWSSRSHMENSLYIYIYISIFGKSVMCDVTKGP